VSASKINASVSGQTQCGVQVGLRFQAVAGSGFSERGDVFFEQLVVHRRAVTATRKVRQVDPYVGMASSESGLNRSPNRVLKRVGRGWRVDVYIEAAVIYSLDTDDEFFLTKGTSRAGEAGHTA
jgi:hypothetical protein